MCNSKTFFTLLLGLWIVASATANACSIVVVSSEKGVLVGNNEDTPLTDARIIFTPGTDTKYGKLILVFDSFMNGFPQGGMNTAGLFFDITATPRSEVAFPGEAIPCDSHVLLEQILEQCGTVEEVLAMIGKHTFHGIQEAQIMFADKSGAAAVIGVGKDQRLQVTRKKDNFMVLTNFNLAQPATGNHPCYRHTLANEMLQENAQPALANLRAILAAIHVEGLANTVYSNIYDLQNGDMHLYYFHNFEAPLKINLEQELQKGPRSITLDSLFPRKPFSSIVAKELQAYFKKLLEQPAPKK